MKKWITKIKTLLKKPFQLLYGLIQPLYQKYLSKWVDKVLYVLSHNFIYHNDGRYIRLLNYIKIKITRRRREHFYGYMFILLWLVGFLVFTFYPMINSLYLSFTESYPHLTRGMSTTFVGVRNYINILRSQQLLPQFQGYIGKMMLSIPLIIVFSIMISMLINQPMKLKGIWRTIFFMPVIIASGPVIVELTAQDATSLPSITESGAIGFIVENLGTWISNPLEALFNSLLLILWYAGVPILIFLAGLQKIDSSIYEAASIDGASPWDNFWKITLPSIKPLISVAIIYVVVSMSLYVEPGGILDQARMHMLNGGPDSALFYGYGYAAAISWIYFLIMLIIMGIFIGLMAFKRKKVKRWN